jgi:hypothetical protein
VIIGTKDVVVEEVDVCVVVVGVGDTTEVVAVVIVDGAAVEVVSETPVKGFALLHVP